MPKATVIRVWNGTKALLMAVIGLSHSLTQVASCTNQMGQISIVAMQNSSPKVTECFNVESRILCMAYVPTEEGLANGVGGSDGDPQPGKNTHTPTICLGMEEGRYGPAISATLCTTTHTQHRTSSLHSP